MPRIPAVLLIQINWFQIKGIKEFVCILNYFNLIFGHVVLVRIFEKMMKGKERFQVSEYLLVFLSFFFFATSGETLFNKDDNEQSNSA